MGPYGHSATRGQSNDDENRVVLLAAAVHDGHGRPGIIGKPVVRMFEGEHNALSDEQVGKLDCLFRKAARSLENWSGKELMVRLPLRE